MDSHAIKVPVIASIPMDCIFWAEADGWAGTCAQLSLTVRGTGFEDAKKNMEATLQTYISGFVQERKPAA
jgi:predicted RNase H-like HicB family nuclease